MVRLVGRKRPLQPLSGHGLDSLQVAPKRASHRLRLAASSPGSCGRGLVCPGIPCIFRAFPLASCPTGNPWIFSNGFNVPLFTFHAFCLFITPLLPFRLSGGFLPDEMLRLALKRIFLIVVVFACCGIYFAPIRKIRGDTYQPGEIPGVAFSLTPDYGYGSQISLLVPALIYPPM